jgi:hypothetical protein
LPKVTRGANGLGYKKARQGDVHSLVQIDNPDDAEFARPLGEGDGESLVKIDNPDDAHIYDADKQAGGKAGLANNGKKGTFKP